MAVVERAHGRHEPDHAPGRRRGRSAARSVSIVSHVLIAWPAARWRRRGPVQRLELRPARSDRGDMVRLDGLAVAAHERPGGREAVVHRPPHEGLERLRRRPGRVHEVRRRVVQGREERGRDRRGRVVDGTLLVVQLERLAARAARRARSRRSRTRRTRPRPRPRRRRAAPARSPRWNVCSGCRAKRRRCGSSEPSRVAPLVCATQGPGGIERATSATRRSGTQRRTRSAPRTGELTPRQTGLWQTLARAGRAPPCRRGLRRRRLLIGTSLQLLSGYRACRDQPTSGRSGAGLTNGRTSLVPFRRSGRAASPDAIDRRLSRCPIPTFPLDRPGHRGRRRGGR